MADIFREQTAEERKNFIDLRNYKHQDLRQQALVTIAEKEQYYHHKLKQPFCTKCAITAVDNRLDEISDEVKKLRRSNTRGEQKIDFGINYDDFANEINFSEVDETEIVEDKLIDGIRQSVATGKYKNYICTNCNSKLSIEIKNRETEEQAKTPQKNADKKEK